MSAFSIKQNLLSTHQFALPDLSSRFRAVMFLVTFSISRLSEVHNNAAGQPVELVDAAGHVIHLRRKREKQG